MATRELKSNWIQPQEKPVSTSKCKLALIIVCFMSSFPDGEGDAAKVKKSIRIRHIHLFTTVIGEIFGHDWLTS